MVISRASRPRIRQQDIGVHSPTFRLVEFAALTSALNQHPELSAEQFMLSDVGLDRE